MMPRTLLIPCLALMVCLAAFAGPAARDTPPRFLAPPEVVKIIDQSKVMYNIVIGMESLQGVNSANTVDQLFPLSAPEINCPWRIQKADGSVEIVEFPFPPESMKLMNESESHFVAGRYSQAAGGYQTVANQFPDCYLAYAHLGDAYFKMKQYNTAIEHFNTAIRLNPWDHRTFLYKADALFYLARYEEAKVAYIQALSLRPRYWVALKNLQHLADKLGVQVRTDLFQPRAFVRQEKDDIAVYVTDKDTAPWLSYALTKAIWLGEPSHRQELVGSSMYKWSSVEEIEALLNLVIVYQTAKQDGKVGADPKLDLLEKIAETHDLDNLVCYEMASRLCPYIMLTVSEEARQSMREFIAKYVVVPASKQPAERQDRRIAAAAPASASNR